MALSSGIIALIVILSVLLLTFALLFKKFKKLRHAIVPRLLSPKSHDMADALVSHQDTQHVLAAYRDRQLSEDVFPTKLQSSPRTPPAARGRGFVTIGSIATVHAQLSDLEKMKEMCQQQDATRQADLEITAHCNSRSPLMFSGKTIVFDEDDEDDHRRRHALSMSSALERLTPAVAHRDEDELIDSITSLLDPSFSPTQYAGIPATRI